jgi:uncharacterized repeat protein (TIGR03803 family)
VNRFSFFFLSAALMSIVGCPMADAHASKETVVYSFQNNGADGQVPEATLLSVKETLYGTTVTGGANDAGAVFAINRKTDAEKVVYSFQNNETDGNSPVAPLTDLKGTLYGVTQTGGSENCQGGGCGTVYSLNPKTGSEMVLYSFCSQENCTDGEIPVGPLVEENGLLYGITLTGGQQNQDCQRFQGSGCGVVFSIDPSTGAETELYAFCSQQDCVDGYLPSGGLVDVGGTLYGVAEGGANNRGVLYSIDPASGMEHVVYSYSADGTDGGVPDSLMTNVNGILYGTTSSGGKRSAGEVLAFNLKEDRASVIYSFCRKTGCPDGQLPENGVIEKDGILYGTTLWGGNRGCGNAGCGVAFSVNPQTGTEKVLYSFCNDVNCADGGSPVSGLIYQNKKLYGTTEQGGTGTCNQYLIGCGTVFSVKP